MKLIAFIVGLILVLSFGQFNTALADARNLEFRERYSEAKVSISYAGRLIRTYDYMVTGSLVREFTPPPSAGNINRLFLISVSGGGNMCVDTIAVIDASRSPPFASDIFGGCNPAIIVGRHDHLALSFRSDGSRPDDVWFYDGRSVRQLPRLSRTEHIRRAQQAIGTGNKIDALRHLLAVADHSDPLGPYGLARMLRAGDPVDRDDRLARDLLVRGAEMGHTPSMIELAQMLREGLGGPADIGEAHRWIRLAAERGNGQGQLAWARALKDGDGVPPNAKEALVWFRLAEAVLAGHTEAQQAKEAAEALTTNLGDASVVEVASRIAAFRPVPPGAVWNLPSDWGVWERRHPLNRVRGTTLFEMPEFAAIFRPLLGTPIYTTLASRSGPGSITINGDWLLVSACKAHFCNRDHFFLALRRDGRDAAACVLTPEEVPGTRRLIGNLTYVRMHAPRQLREDIANSGCPRELTMLLSIAPPPPGRPPLALDRDAPWPPPVATPVAPRQAPPPQAAARPRGTAGQIVGTGTAWRVADGRFVTNAHVIEGCGTIRLSAGGPTRDIARIIAKDTSLDLALLQADVATIGVLSVRAAPPRPGEPVVVAGYPLQGILASGPQVSTGIVTALAGLQDDITRLQISAPVQPGNSGGPVLDRQGLVVGVAVSTIGTLATAVATGTLPQNVNFAIKADRVSAFLASANTQTKERQVSNQLTTEDIAANALSSVALVECIAGR